jgi:hypothetical protein
MSIVYTCSPVYTRSYRVVARPPACSCGEIELLACIAGSIVRRSINQRLKEPEDSRGTVGHYRAFVDAALRRRRRLRALWAPGDGIEIFTTPALAHPRVLTDE